MLEESKDPSIFTMSVGNLPEKSAVLISITYVCELQFEEGDLKFVLPSRLYEANGGVIKFVEPKVKLYTFSCFCFHFCDWF